MANKTIRAVLVSAKVENLDNLLRSIRGVLKSELFVGPETDSKLDEIMG